MQPRKDWLFICIFNCFSLLLLLFTELKAFAPAEWVARMRGRQASARLED